MRSFVPHGEILSPAQQRLWPKLGSVSRLGLVLYGRDFQPSESLKALVFFEGGDLHTLSSEDKEVLIEAASTVRDLPRPHRRPRTKSEHMNYVFHLLIYFESTSGWPPRCATLLLEEVP